MFVLTETGSAKLRATSNGKSHMSECRAIDLGTLSVDYRWGVFQACSSSSLDIGVP